MKRAVWEDHLGNVIVSNFDVGEKFTLSQLYKNSAILKRLYPNNDNINAAIRKYLSVLIKNGLIERVDKGVYKRTPRRDKKISIGKG